MDRNMRIQDEDQLDKLAGHTHTHTLRLDLLLKTIGAREGFQRMRGILYN